MTTYQVVITLGSGSIVIADCLVSRMEAEAILRDTHPALNPEIKEVNL